MKNMLFFLFLAISISANAQTDKKINIGTIETIKSKILNETREIWVHVPNDGNTIFSQQKYPVVYVLDGDSHFLSTVGTIQQMSAVNGTTNCPEMIVVSILNTNRTRDLTPTKVPPSLPYVNQDISNNSGGGEAFLEFIEKELIPMIESKYPTEPYRTFVGHSFGGLTVMNTLQHRPDLFNSYVAIDPSMWWDGQKLLKEFKSSPTKKYEGKSLFLSIANTMAEGMDVETVEVDTTIDTKHIRSLLDIDRFLKSNKSGLRYESKFYENDSHGSVPMISTYDGIRFLFDFYDLKIGPTEFTTPGLEVAKKVENHYANLTKQFGYEVKPPESLVNSFGYNLMGIEDFEKAEYFFKMNVTNYPESYNVYDSYGDYFIAKKDKLNAIVNLKKALALKENEESRRKLISLMNE